MSLVEPGSTVSGRSLAKWALTSSVAGRPAGWPAVSRKASGQQEGQRSAGRPAVSRKASGQQEGQRSAGRPKEKASNHAGLVVGLLTVYLRFKPVSTINIAMTRIMLIAIRPRCLTPLDRSAQDDQSSLHPSFATTAQADWSYSHLATMGYYPRSDGYVPAGLLTHHAA